MSELNTLEKNEAESVRVTPNEEFMIFQITYERLVEKMPATNPEDVLQILFHDNLPSETEQLLTSIGKQILRKNIWQISDRIEFAKLMAGKQLLDVSRQINLKALKHLMIERLGLSDQQCEEVISFWRNYIETNTE